MLSLFMQQFPFCFLMLLGYISGIDPTLEKSARTLGAGSWTVFRRVMFPLIAPGIAIAFALVFVMSFAVFPSAILLGQPAGSTRTIAIAAYHQAFEHYDMSYASAIAVIMGLCQLAGLVLIVLVRQRMVDGADHGRRETVTMRGRLWHLALYIFVLGFILNLLGIVTHVTMSAFAKRWFGTPLPPQFTTDWFVYAWNNFDLDRVLTVTVMVALAVVVLALAIAYPAAYILARRNFRGKALLLLLYFLPLVIPQMTYGISLATTLYGWPIGGTIVAVILANLVPMVPLAIFVLIPVLRAGQPEPRMGRADARRKPGADLPPHPAAADVPGLLTAGVLILVNTVSNFELTFLVSGSGSQTLVVALFYNVFAGGVRPVYSVDAMALMYMTTVLVLLLIALRFVRPTQMVFRLDRA